jgi:hypothetical protein
MSKQTKRSVSLQMLLVINYKDIIWKIAHIPEKRNRN